MISMIIVAIVALAVIAAVNLVTQNLISTHIRHREHAARVRERHERDFHLSGGEQ